MYIPAYKIWRLKREPLIPQVGGAACAASQSRASQVAQEGVTIVNWIDHPAWHLAPVAVIVWYRLFTWNTWHPALPSPSRGGDPGLSHKLGLDDSRTKQDKMIASKSNGTNKGIYNACKVMRCRISPGASLLILFSDSWTRNNHSNNTDI